MFPHTFFQKPRIEIHQNTLTFTVGVNELQTRSRIHVKIIPNLKMNFDQFLIEKPAQTMIHFALFRCQRLYVNDTRLTRCGKSINNIANIGNEADVPCSHRSVPHQL